MKWIIKQFNDLETEELYDLIALRNEVFILEQECHYQDADGKDKKSWHIYLQSTQDIIAYARVVDKGVSYAEMSIGRVLVNPKYRGQAYGKQLMRRVIDFIEQERGEYRIRISAQSYLLRFYGEFGFQIVSDEYLEDDIPHTEMLYTSV